MKPQTHQGRLPVVALIGRPNVGKSTLFNVLTATRDALVADVPGLTRDRQYGYAEHDGRRFLVVDTGGITRDADDPAIAERVQAQTRLAIDEADVLCLLVDARAGLTAEDRRIADELRRAGRYGEQPVLMVVNKSEGLQGATAASEFFELGLEEWVGIAAAHKQGTGRLLNWLVEHLPPEQASAEPDTEPGAAVKPIRVALVGRPNAGKSTLMNRLLGEERVLASEKPGTTRDSVAVPFERDGQAWVLVDTAGMRRRSKIDEDIEKLSVLKTLEAVEDAQVVIAMIDAQAGIAAQDVRLIGLVAERGRALVVAINKWDGLDDSDKARLHSELDRKLPFLDYARKIEVSALHGTGVGKLLKASRSALIAARREMATPDLTRELEAAVHRHPPPAVTGRRIKLRYAHQGGHNPPVIVIHGNQTEKLPRDYRRYLVNHFRDAFNLHGTPIRLEFRTGDNPYKGKRNKLTPRQQRSRKRMMRHHKK